jgi:hypothetical protein
VLLVEDPQHELAHLNHCFPAIVEGAFIAISTCTVTSAKVQLLELLSDILKRVRVRGWGGVWLCSVCALVVGAPGHWVIGAPIQCN